MGATQLREEGRNLLWKKTQERAPQMPQARRFLVRIASEDHSEV